MSSEADKDLSKPRESTGRATATLAQLKAVWGLLTDSGDRVEIRGMRVTVWRRTSGRGEKATYEIEEERHD